MESIRYCDLPKYLQKGDFFRSLASDDPESLIEIPGGHFHRDGKSVANLDEFRDLLKTTAFWMLDEMPPGILDFCDRTEAAQWVDEIFRFPEAVQSMCFGGLVAAYSATNLSDFANFIQTIRWEGAVTVAVQYGRVECLRYLLEHECPYINRICDVACSFNQLACLALLLFYGAPCDVDTSYVAARLPDAACLQCLRDNGCPWDNITTRMALVYGQVETLSYAMERACPYDDDIVVRAARGQSLECLQYLIEGQAMTFSKSAYFAALLSGNVVHLQYLVDQWCPVGDVDAVKVAVTYGHGGCLQYLLDSQCPYINTICDVACNFNQPACLLLLLAHGAPCDVDTSYVAARLPDAACLQCLRDNGCPWDNITIRMALVYGQVATLSYAMERACPCDDDIVVRAARGQSLECLQYLIEGQAMEFSERAYVAALLSGNLVHLQYLVDQGCPAGDLVPSGAEDVSAIYDEYFTKGNPKFLECAEFAAERGWVAPDNLVHYLINRDLSNCAQLCVKQNWLAYSSTGEGFLKFVKEVSRNDTIPSVRFVLEKDRFYIDNMFSQKWDAQFVQQNIPLLRSVNFAMMYGWQPDDPIRHTTGISLWYCSFMRVFAYSLVAFCNIWEIVRFMGRVWYEIVGILCDYWWCIGIYLSPLHHYLKVVAYVCLIPELLMRILTSIGRLRYPAMAVYPKEKVD